MKALIINLNEDIGEEEVKELEDCISDRFDCFSSIQREGFDKLKETENKKALGVDSK